MGIAEEEVVFEVFFVEETVEEGVVAVGSEVSQGVGGSEVDYFDEDFLWSKLRLQFE